jgi:hypothetical protein
MDAPAPTGSIGLLAVAGPGPISRSELALDSDQALNAAHRVMQTHVPDPQAPHWCGECEGDEYPCPARLEARALLVEAGRLVLAVGSARGLAVYGRAEHGAD